MNDGSTTGPPWRRVLRRLAAADPGLERRRTATTATAAVAATLELLAVINGLTGQPVTVALLGAVLSLNASLTVADPTSRARRATMLLAVAPASGAVTLGALLAGHPLAGAVAFVGVMVAAVLSRRAGPRWSADRWWRRCCWCSSACSSASTCSGCPRHR